MLEVTQDLFDNPTQSLPPRSYLYHLPMRGCGTGLQEPLLDYMQRLAREHVLEPMDLMRELVVPRTSIRAKLYEHIFAQSHSKTINGYCKYASDVCEVLTELTKIPNLADGTFLAWRPLFNKMGSGLLHSSRRWCPECFSADAEDGREPHYRLVWASECVTHCGIHKLALQSTCAKCGIEQAHINPAIVFAHCMQCGCPLSRRRKDGVSIGPREMFMYRAVSGMVAVGSSAADFVDRANVSRRMREVADVAADGTMQQLGRLINFVPSTLRGWENGINGPRLDTFLEFCYRIGTFPVPFLRDGYRMPIYLRTWEKHRTRELRVMTVETRRALEAEVHTIIQSHAAWVDAKALVKKYQTSVGQFKYALPEAYQLLMEHRKRTQAILTTASRENLATGARDVVRRLFKHSTRVTRGHLGRALADVGLCIRCPYTRAAAFEELELLRSQEAGALIARSRQLSLDPPDQT
jgi:hypothetical protein